MWEMIAVGLLAVPISSEELREVTGFRPLLPALYSILLYWTWPLGTDVYRRGRLTGGNSIFLAMRLYHSFWEKMSQCGYFGPHPNPVSKPSVMLRKPKVVSQGALCFIIGTSGGRVHIVYNIPSKNLLHLHIPWTWTNVQAHVSHTVVSYRIVQLSKTQSQRHPSTWCSGCLYFTFKSLSCFKLMHM